MSVRDRRACAGTTLPLGSSSKGKQCRRKIIRHTCARPLSLLVCKLSILLFAAAPASAQTIAWDPNTESNLAGYLVLSGTQPGTYSSQTDAGLATSLPITGIDVTKNTYFAVQAYTSDGLLSGFSKEVMLPAAVPPLTTAIASLHRERGRAAADGHAGDVERQRNERRGTGGVQVRAVPAARRVVGCTGLRHRSTFTWTPGWNDIGKAAVQVWVRAVGSTAAYEAWRGTDVFDINTAPAKLTADTSFPSPAGQPVLWTAQIAGSPVALDTGSWCSTRRPRHGRCCGTTKPATRRAGFPRETASTGCRCWRAASAARLPTRCGPAAAKSSSRPRRWLSPRSLPTGPFRRWSGRLSPGLPGHPAAPPVPGIQVRAVLGAGDGLEGRAGLLDVTNLQLDADVGRGRSPTCSRCGRGTAGRRRSYDAWLPTKTFEIEPAKLQLTTDSVFPVPPAATVLWTASVPDPSLSLEYAFFVYDRSSGDLELRAALRSGQHLRLDARADGLVCGAGLGAPRGIDRLLRSLAGNRIPGRGLVPRAPHVVHGGHGHCRPRPARPSRGRLSPAAAPRRRSSTASCSTARAAAGVCSERYSAGRSVTWTPGAQDAGTHALQVWVRSVGSAASYEDWQRNGVVRDSTLT